MTSMSAPECPFYNTNLSSNSIEPDNGLLTCNTLYNVFGRIIWRGYGGVVQNTPKRTPLKA